MTSPSPPPGRLTGIDTLRGLSAIAVLVCHIAGYWTFMNLPWKLPQLMALGAHGVDIFIVISGFVLFLPVVRAMGQLDSKQFYGRRALRILPAYYVALAIAALLAMGPRTWDLVVGSQATFPELLLHIFGVQTWFPGTLGSINGSLWSISLELHLYLVFPLLVAVWRRWGMAPLLIGSVALAAIWTLSRGLDVSGPVGFGLGGIHALPARLLQFVIGMWCATRLVSGGSVRPRTWAAGSLVFGLVSVIASTTEQNEVLVHIAWGALGACLVLLMCGLRVGGKAIEVSEEFGERAYSFYLLHQPALLVVGPLVALLPGWPAQLLIGGTATFLLITAMAAVMYRYVELPTHRLGRRMFPGPSVRRTHAAP
ncbi:acyltransferase [Ornithinimicrobium ciconiae]|uniref:Acyltransferase n=1 Tax=Ornithinimicrobium ciconiae TaxID=2594265 RepID=A0A516G7T2_9MICO|nr:acyltransferase [Ornithinimicrobium ciconiae]QDO87420.1 acyltransferase [Ornithinimicrobium ciconiae]